MMVCNCIFEVIFINCIKKETPKRESLMNVSTLRKNSMFHALFVLRMIMFNVFMTLTGFFVFLLFYRRSITYFVERFD